MGKAKMKKMDLTPAEIAKLKASLKENTSVQAWNGKEIKIGAVIFGVVTEIVEIKSKKKNVSPTNLMKLQTADGLKGVWCKTVIQTFVDENKIKSGDKIGIEYLGKVKNYHNYHCVKL
jgi:hypothetical protein